MLTISLHSNSILAVFGIDDILVMLFWTAVTMGLGYLGARLMAPAAPDDAAYSGVDVGTTQWGKHTTQEEGLPRARAYGKNLHHGNIISKWTDVDDNAREVLYTLLDCGDGPTKGLVYDQDYFRDEALTINGGTGAGSGIVGTAHGVPSDCLDGQGETSYGVDSALTNDVFRNWYDGWANITIEVVFGSTIATLNEVSYYLAWPCSVGWSARTNSVSLYYSGAWHEIGTSVDNVTITGPWTNVTKMKMVLYGRSNWGPENTYMGILCSRFEAKGETVDVQHYTPHLFINDQPVVNFPDATVQERLGTMDQTAMTGFEKPKLEYGNPQELLQNEEFIFTTPNNSFDDIEFTVCFPNGLRMYHTSGGMGPTTCGFRARIREHPAGAWTDLFNDNIAGGVLDPYYRKFIASTQGFTCVRGKQYDIGLTKTSADNTERIVNNLFFRSIREVYDTAFTHPGKALVGVKAVATSRLSGRLDMKVIREDRVIATYDADEVQTLEYSRNRAWVVWDELTQPVIVGNGDGIPYSVARYEGIDPQYLDFEFFYNWSVFCATEIDDGDGGTEPRCACDIIIKQFTDVYTLACNLAKVGRAYLYWKGDILTGWIDTIVDAPKDLVTMDTIMHKSWKNNWAIAEELAGVVEVLYEDSKQGYERVPVEYSNEYAGGYTNSISIEGDGIKTRGTAVHLAAYLLERNHLIRNQNSFRVAKPGFRYDLGDVIRLQCRIANWGKAFRVVSSTVNTVTVDRDASTEVSVGDVIHIRSYDTVLKVVVTDTYEVDSVVGKIITATINWDVTPVKGNIVAVGPAGAIKERRIIKMTPTIDNYFDVEVETYDEDLFDTDSIDPDNPNISYIWPGILGSVNNQLTKDDVQQIVSNAVPDADDVDLPVTSNVTWNSDTPSAGYISWSKTNEGDAKDSSTSSNTYVSIYGDTWESQTFTPDTSYDHTYVELLLYKVGTPGIITVSLYPTVAGKTDTSGAPLATMTFDGTSLGVDTNGTWITCQYVSDYSLIAGTTYGIVLSNTGIGAGNAVCWRLSNANPYGGGCRYGSNDAGTNWMIGSSDDFAFKTDTYSDISFRYRGTTYTIDIGSTNKEFVYFDPDSPTIFSTTDSRAVAFAAGNFFLCWNDAGAAKPVTPQQLIHAGIIELNTIITEQLTDLAISDDALTYIEGKTPTTYGTFWTMAQVVDFETSGRSISIHASCLVESVGGDNAADFQIKRTGGAGPVYFIQSTEPVALIDGEPVSVAFNFIDEDVPAGTYSYSLLADKNINADVVSCFNRIISVLEMKR